MEELKNTIEALLEEERKFVPPEQFKHKANVKDPRIYNKASRDPESFWSSFARQLEWFEPWDQTLKWEPPWVNWFLNGKINASYNCIDRHIRAARKNKAAIIWEGEPKDTRILTYFDLYREVSKFANVLKDAGVKKGDIVTIYLPMIPELPIAMLACARIGAPHSVVFAGFSPGALRGRMEDAESRFLVTCDGYYRRGKRLNLKQDADRTLKRLPEVEKVIVVKRTGQDTNFTAGRDFWWNELMEDAKPSCEPEVMDAEDVLFLMYTSGTTGKPKGVVHTTGGYLVGAYATTKLVFDVKEEDTYWCCADIGWITGHTYIVYGPLLCGATTLMYEGAPDYPEKDRLWEMVEKYGVNIFYTALPQSALLNSGEKGGQKSITYPVLDCLER